MSGTSQSPSATSKASFPITQGLSFRRHFRPYFTKRQLEILAGLKRDRESAARNVNCKFIQQVGKKLGFPQLTISTAQALYHRFYLYYSARQYDHQDINVTCIWVASKIRETIKKVQDIYAAVRNVKYPKNVDLEPAQLSEDRFRRILAYEKLLLETLCFDFQLQQPFEYVIKYVKYIQGQRTLDGKSLAHKAYHLAVDSYRTSVCVEYPAHTIAAGCIYLASRLLANKDPSLDSLALDLQWDRIFCSRMDDIEDVCQQILDLYICCCESHEKERYTGLKIELNEQAQRREPDPYMDAETTEAMKSRTDSWAFDSSSPLDIVNSNQHTVSYSFS